MKTFSEFQTSFSGAVMTPPKPAGDNVAVSGGVVLNGGQKATNTECGTLVTTVTAGGVGSVSGSVGVGGTIANKG